MRFFLLAFVMFAIGVSSSVSAAETLVLISNTDVYKKINGAKVRTLPKGASVDVIKEKTGWLKIQYIVKDKNFIGYILADGDDDSGRLENDEEESEDEFEFDSDKGDVEKSSARSSLFFSGVFSFAYQGERDLQTTPDTIYDLSIFTGSSVFFEFGWRKPLASPWTLNLSLVRRTLFLTGEAKVRESVTNSQSDFELTETGIGIQAGALYRMNESWSLLALLELTKINSVELVVVNGTLIDDSEIDAPMHVVMIGGFAYHTSINKNWELEFQLRGGSFVTTDPVTIILESAAQIHYMF
jgi:hypothetical protein